MALILDTNALSAFADGDARLRRVIEDEPELAVPSIVLGEYLFGLRQSRHRRRYEAWLAAADFIPLPVGPVTAESYAEIRSELKSAGQSIPTNDLWIAALSREHGFGIVSRDRHFSAVSGITLISW